MSYLTEMVTTIGTMSSEARMATIALAAFALAAYSIRAVVAISQQREVVKRQHRGSATD